MRIETCDFHMNDKQGIRRIKKIMKEYLSEMPCFQRESRLAEIIIVDLFLGRIVALPQCRAP